MLHLLCLKLVDCVKNVQIRVSKVMYTREVRFISIINAHLFKISYKLF